ncbi:MAG: hypothetical protein IKN38_01600, partial [Clostridia bacterium]|nr:hypothetical protein [Clostridia bacterium]
MADEKSLEEEYFEAEIYTLTDEDGVEEDFELIGKYMEDSRGKRQLFSLRYCRGTQRCGSDAPPPTAGSSD